MNGYLMDILVAFDFYFLLARQETSLLKPWPVKALLVLGARASAFGRIFDPVDFVMYGLGVVPAAFVATAPAPAKALRPGSDLRCGASDGTHQACGSVDRAEREVSRRATERFGA